MNHQEMVDKFGTIAYFAVKGIAAAVTVIAPQLAPVTVPIIIGG